MAFLLTLVALIAVAQREIGIRNVDAVSNVLGAHSIQGGRGYTMDGEPITFWPPAYSFVISRFPDPAVGAFVVNHAALAAVAVAIFSLSRMAGWSLVPAAAVAGVCGIGPFRILASNAQPDVVQYALFFWGVRLWLVGARWAQTAGSALFGVAILFKQMAVVFAPAIVLAACLLNRRVEWRAGLTAAGFWVAGLTALCGFNLYTAGRLYPSSHLGMASGSIASSLADFLFSAGREFCGNVYGSVKASPGREVFAAATLAGAVAWGGWLDGRRVDSRLLVTGGCVFAFAWVLRVVVGYFDCNLRTLGYGVYLAALGLQPSRTRWTTALWIVYLAVAAGVSGWNVVVAGNLGMNDPRYREAVRTAGRLRLPDDGVLATNSFYLMDLHTGVRTQRVADPAEVSVGRYYLHFDLPKYDAIADAVTQVELPREGWEVVDGQGLVTLLKRVR